MHTRVRVLVSMHGDIEQGFERHVLSRARSSGHLLKPVKTVLLAANVRRVEVIVGLSIISFNTSSA